MRKAIVAVASVLVLAGLIGFAVTHSPRAGSTAGSSSEGAAGTASVPAGIAASPGTRSGPAGPGAVPLARQVAVPAIGPDIVRTANLSVRVRRGGFRAAFQSAAAVATRAGGYVLSSGTSGIRSGWLELRVPAASFTRAIAELSGLGTVRAQTIRGQDVTGAIVDLGARIRALSAQRTVLLGLMSRATTIAGTLRVQSALQQVQTSIERLRGELRTLRGQVALASITVSLREVGAPVPSGSAVVNPSLARAWAHAVAGFLGVLAAVVVGLGYLVPVGLLGLGLWVAVRRLTRRSPAPAS